MKRSCTGWLCLSLIIAAGPLTLSVQGGLLKIDFGALQNFDDIDWDVFENFTFGDDEELPLRDWSDRRDDDVTLLVMDSVDGDGTGFTANNPDVQNKEYEYDGVTVPPEVNDDYLYRTPDTAGTSARFRFSNLDPGQCNVTVFEGRPTDANGQYAKIWVDPDPSGAAEPEDENTGNFAHGFSTMEVSIGAGGLLRNPRRETVRSA